MTRFDLDGLCPELRDHWLASAIREIQKNYVYDGLIGAELFQETVIGVLGRLPDNAYAFLLGPSEKVLHPEGGLSDFPRHMELNRWLREIVGTLPNVALLAMDDYVEAIDERDIRQPNHFARQVYFRLYEDVRRRIGDLAFAGDDGGTPMPADSGLTELDM